MPKYILQELPEEMTDGKKIVFPIVADPNSGITTRGTHSHKVWIAKNEGD